MIGNRLITRGMGTSRGAPGRAGMVTQGYGGPPSFVVKALETPRRVVKGGSGYGRRDELDELNVVILWAKLIEINSRPPEKKIEGKVIVKIDKSSGVAIIAERLIAQVYKAWNDIKITVKRLK